MKKNYSRPVAAEEVFTPNHYMASCEIEVNKEYVVNPDGFLAQGIHLRYDKNQDREYTSDDASYKTLTSNSLTDQNAKLYYVGFGWGINEGGNGKDWPTPPKTESEMKALGYELFFLFSNQKGDPTTNSGNVKVYGGDEIEKIIKNQS